MNTSLHPLLTLRKIGLAVLACCACLMAMGVQADAPDAPAPPMAISASAEQITVTLADPSVQHVVVSTSAVHDDRQQTVHRGAVQNGKLTFDRVSGDQDLAYRRFYLAVDGQAPQGPYWLTAFERTVTPPALPWPDEIKGLSNPMSAQDLADLGSAHTHINLLQRELFLTDGAARPADDFVWQVNGRALYFDPQRIAELDQQVYELTRAGVNVVAVFLNRIERDDTADHPLVHPATDVAQAPTRLAAFNLTTQEGVDHYLAALGFLADRYSRPNSEHGLITAYIIGNEVDAHWTWHNMGSAPLEQVARQYALELRLGWIAIREQHPGVGVFASFTHSWTRANSGSEMHNVAGRTLLDQLAAIGRAEGDFDWGLAHHPYPQNLFEPRFWNDQMAMYGMDSPMITFKNLEVLAEYLRRPELVFNGQPRRLILSEQGLHAPDGDTGEILQAGAMALAYWRIRHIDAIEAFILHRHVDHPGEGGLKLGVRRWGYEADGVTPSEDVAGAPKLSWHVFQAMGTPEFERVARFALPLAGYDTWAQALPKPGPFPDEAPEWADQPRPSEALFDLTRIADRAEVDNALAFENRLSTLLNGGVAESLFLHPPGEGTATATWTLDLPADTPARLTFQAFLGHEDSDGADFVARINGQVVFEKALRPMERIDADIDLAQHAGRQITLSLEVGPGETNANDWAYWLNPRLE
ncbi:MAG: DUF5722 domain-containing protein [Planctomycetota bacterium]